MAMQSLGFSATDFMQAIIDSIPSDPYFDNPDANNKWWWHSSALSFCPRRSILERAGLAKDPRPLRGEMTMRVGTLFHGEAERGIHHLARYGKRKVTVLHTEQAFYHKDIPLASKPDGVLEIEGIGIVPYDVKTEREEAARRRSQDARDNGSYTSAKAEHMVQVAGQAECLESNGVGPISQGFVFYFSKNSGWLEIAPIDLTDTTLRREPRRLVNNLEAAWAAWQQGVATKRIVLPQRLPTDSWQCRSQKGSEYGEYCAARSVCQDPRMPR